MRFHLFSNDHANGVRCGWLGTTIFATTLLFAPAMAGAVGYTPRACGFDLNADGVLGDPARDCNICNGTPVSGKNQIYVDCQGGNDTAGSGAPNAPFHTIQHAFDTASAGVQNIVCFKGTCNEQNITPKQGGVAGAYTRDGFEYPTTPAMLVGWDANGNGDYPPHDTSDVAVLDGQNAMAWAIDNNVPVGYLELAHFTVRNYTNSTDGGFMKMAHSTGRANHIYLHDLSLQNINKGQPSTSSTVIVFNFFISGTLTQHVAISNSEILDYGGGYLARGAGDNSLGDNGPFRFQNLNVRSCGQTGGSIAGIKLWDMITGIDVLDNYFDANPTAWSPSTGPTYAVHACNCTRNWTVRHNEFHDYKQAFLVDPDIGSQFCTARAMDNLIFDANKIRNTYSSWQYGDEVVQVLSGSTQNNSVNNVAITNNFISSTSPMDTCIWSNAGNNGGTQAGTITIANNTCSMSIARFASIAVGALGGTLPTFPQQNYVIKDNIVTGLASGNVNINTQYVPSNLVLDGNVYDPNGGFSWNSSNVGSATQLTLADWRTVSHEGVASKSCLPGFVNQSGGDLHLASSDSCAQNAGVSLSGVTTVDIDGDTRPQGSGWDIGADELGGAPQAPTLLQVIPVSG